MRDTDLVKLLEALQMYPTGGATCVPLFNSATVEIGFEQQPLEIRATPTTSSLKIEIVDRRCGHAVRGADIQVDWTEDLEVNLDIWDALVAPYVRLTKKLLHL